MLVVVAASLLQAAPLGPFDVFLDDELTVPRSVDVDEAARKVATSVFVSGWEPRTGVPTSVWLPAWPAGTPSPRSQGLDAEAVARRVLFELAPLYRAKPAELASLTVSNRHELGDGAVVVSFTRRVGELPVFRDRIAVVLSHELEPVGVLGAVPPFAAPPLTFLLTADTALDVARRHLGLVDERSKRQSSLRPDGWTVHADGSLSRRTVFATARLLVPAFELELESPAGGYGVVVSARDGQVLMRNPHQFSFSYRTWASTTAPFTPLDSPEGDTTPHPTGLPDGWAPAMLTTPMLVALDHAGLSTMDPWLPAGATALSGNNASAYADLFAPDGRNAPDGGSPVDPQPVPTQGAFDFAWDPARAPTATETQSLAAATHAFFVANWLHDLLYDVGFDERAGNAQGDNKGRGGRQADALRVEVNDFAGVFGGSLLAGPDGTAPTLQLFPGRRAGRAVVTFSPALAVDGGPGNDGAPPLREGTWNTSAAVTKVVSVDGGSDLCGPFTNSAALAGRVAFGFASGPCGSFGGLDDLAADAGAVGLLVQNAFDTRDEGLTLPTHLLDAARASALTQALGQGPVTATLERVPTVDRPVALDTTVITHELGHLVSQRLVGDGNGLLANPSRGLGEGWSDFLALLSTLEAGDLQKPGNADWRGAYVIGAFARSQTGYGGQRLDNHYFGARRFPLSIDPAKNALSLKHIVSNVPLPTATPLSPDVDSQDNAEPHNTGEVWAAMLWEGATRLLKDPRTTSFTDGKRRLLQLMVASLKATPVNPLFVDQRDAVLIVARASNGAEFTSFLDGFATRGLGLAAQTPNRRSTTNAPVAEDTTNTGARWTLLDVKAKDDLDACDNDGVIDLLETGTVTLKLMNVGSRPLMNSRLDLSADDSVLVLSKSSVVVPTAEPFTPISLDVPAELKNELSTAIAQSRVFVSSPDGFLEASPVFRIVRVNTDLVKGTKETFETNAPGWSFGQDGVAWEAGFRVSSPINRVLEGALFGPNAPFPGTTWANSPSFMVGTDPFSFTFTHSYAFEFDRTAMKAYDGAQLRISVDGGPFTLIPGSAISRVIGASTVTGYDGALEQSQTNPLSGQQAFRGTASNQRVTVSLGTQYAGRSVRLQFLIGTDFAGTATGWTIDDVALTGVMGTPFEDVGPHRARCVNKPPILQTAFPQNVDERTRVTLNPPPVTDPNSDMVIFSWVQLTGPTVNLMGDQFDAPEVRTETELTFRATADDGHGGTASQVMTVNVRNVNRPPTSSGGATQTVESGKTVTLAGMAEDPDGDGLTIRWTQLGGPPVTLSQEDALAATFVAPNVTTPSEVNLELTVTDHQLAAPPAVVTIVVNPRGCGCQAFDGTAVLAALLLVGTLRRRR